MLIKYSIFGDSKMKLASISSAQPHAAFLGLISSDLHSIVVWRFVADPIGDQFMQ